MNQEKIMDQFDPCPWEECKKFLESSCKEDILACENVRLIWPEHNICSWSQLRIKLL